LPSARRLKQASRCGEDPRNGREQRLGGDAPSIARLKRGLKQPATASEAAREEPGEQRNAQSQSHPASLLDGNNEGYVYVLAAPLK